MTNSELTLRDAIERLEESFAPVKIIFNGVVLYNDYDSNAEVEAGIYGENKRQNFKGNRRLLLCRNTIRHSRMSCKGLF